MGRTKAIMMLSGALIVFGAVYHVNKMVQGHNEEMQRQIMLTEHGVDPAELDSTVQAADVALEKAAQALKSHDYDEAYRQYKYNAYANVETFAQSWPTNKTVTGITAREWMEQAEAGFQDLVKSEFEWMVGEMKAGRATFEQMRKLLNLDTFRGELQKNFETLREEIATERAKLAGRWCRVVINPDEFMDEYREKITAVLDAKWNDSYGYKLVYGDALNNVERMATWKTIRITVRHDYAQYKKEPRKWEENWHPPTIPHAATIMFKIEEPNRVPSTWDDVPDLVAWVKPPELVSQKRAEEQKEVIAQRLFDKVDEKLEEVPAFELFPGADLDTILLVKDGVFDREAAEQLGVLDPQRLDEEITALMNSGDVSSGALAAALVGMGEEIYADWIAENIPNMERREIMELIRELERRPWFGDQQILAAIVQHADDIPHQALQALKGTPMHPGLKAALEARAASTNQPNGYAYLGYLIQVAPGEELSLYAKWISNADPNMAQTAFVEIQKRNPVLGNELIREYFGAANSKLQTIMIRYFDRDVGKLDYRGTQILKQAALQQEDSQLRYQAYAVFMSGWVNTPRGWDLLAEILEQESDPHKKKEVEQKLLYAVQYAHPDKAHDYYMERARSEEDWVRRASIASLMGSNDPKDAALDVAQELVAAHPEDNELSRDILMSVHQYVRLRSGWNFDQPALIWLVATGKEHPDPQARGFAYGILLAAIEQGHTVHVPLLTAALKEESDSSLRAKFEADLAKTLQNSN